MTRLNENDYFKSSDLALCAAIATHGHVVEAVEKVSRHKLLFFFKRNPTLDELVQSFWKQELRVEPLAYFHHLKTLKSRLYAE